MIDLSYFDRKDLKMVLSLNIWTNPVSSIWERIKHENMLDMKKKKGEVEE